MHPLHRPCFSFRSRTNSTALALAAAAALVMAGCADTADDPPPDTQEDPVGITVNFADSDAHAFTDDERRTITEIAEESHAEIKELLPDLGEVELGVAVTFPDPVTGEEVDAGMVAVPETGEIGASMTPGNVSWAIDPQRDVTEVAQTWLKPRLYHELHHEVRGHHAATGAGGAFIETVVAEGLAVAFELPVTEERPPYAAYPADEVEAWVEEVMALPDEPDYWQYLRQHEDGREWIAYRTGTYIAEQAIANSGKTAADLAHTPTEEILEMAGVATG